MYSVTAEQFHELAQEANALFPNYSKDIFYCNKNGPRGALYSAYNTIREPGIGCNVIKIKKRKSTGKFLNKFS